MIPKEFPRPHMYRKTWRSLNGVWEFDFYDDYFVTSPEEKIAGALDYSIRVPFTYQTALSGIGTGEIHEQVVYRRKIRFSENERKGRTILHFGAVDFAARVWIDEFFIGSHEGGYSPFHFDISRFTSSREELTVSLIVEDKPSPEQPRGKQASTAPFDCWYTAVTGIWQSVWLEFLPALHIAGVAEVHASRSGTLLHRLRLSAPAESCSIEAQVRFNGEPVASGRGECRYPATEMALTIPDPQMWSPEEPNLYEISFAIVKDGHIVDEIETYAAFRELELRKDGLYINGRRYFQKLVLMQGFREESGYTAPDLEGFDRDIRLAKEMGFNGCRMHIKFEDPGFLYAADRLGFLVWGEAPSFYSFTERSVSVFMKELTEIVMRDRMHPCLIAWVLSNESWGMKEISRSMDIQSWLMEMIDLVKMLDPGRPVVSNDGWEHLHSDMMTFHSYEHSADALRDDWEKARRNEPCGIQKKVLALQGVERTDIPWLLSEFGAISFIGNEDAEEHWGYGDRADSAEALLEHFACLVESANSLDGITGWCYTQFSDIEKEKNGLLFADRTPKVKPDEIRAILENK